MSKKEFRDLMIYILQNQIDYIKEEGDESEYTMGCIVGLDFAIEKLKLSEFLLDS